MNKPWMIAAALLAAALAAAPAAARDQVNDSEPVVIQPDRAYIFFRATRRFPLRFLRAVTDRQLAAHQAEREAAFARARRRYERQLANWQRDHDRCGARNAYCRAALGERPAEVTRENFPFAAPELDNFVTVTRGPAFTRAPGAHNYLIAVEPGSYTLYGQITDNPQNGPVGVCLCMGSVSFAARAGEIVDIGEIRYPALAAAESRNGTAASQGRIAAIELAAPTAEMTLPARLSGHPLVRAELHGAGKMPNYFGVQIDRLPAIDGVLAYQRDRVIDVAAAGE
jgi:hypothetical protein